jgi:hypothetical protein
MATENDIVIEAWNTVLFDKFCRFKHLLIDGLSAHSNEAFARHDRCIEGRGHFRWPARTWSIDLRNVKAAAQGARAGGSYDVQRAGAEP